ncbi:MAG TPA: hypothetical protein VFE62_01090, partial [Gemmataceae bacterium]|nr:hypothetical protein [Gemmataceae bacterium]
GDKGPQELTCKKLTIVNADGKPRMVLTYSESGGVIHVMSTEGKKLATIGGEKFGGIFRLYGPDEKRSLILGNNKDGCQINVCDADGNFRAYLGVDGAKEGYLTLKNSKDKTTLYCGEDDDGGLIRAYGHDGKERAFFGVGAKGGDGLIMLYGTDGKRRHWLGSENDISSHYIYSTGGVLQHEIRGGKTGSYHTMMSKDGQSIISTIGASNDSGEGILRLNTVKGKTVAYLGSNKNNTGGLILLNTPEDSSRVVIGIDANGVGFGEGRDADNVVRRSLR